jgi:hypothetical protein
MEEADVIRAAHALSALYADDAVRQAVAHAHKLLEHGDMAGSEDWRRIASAIVELTAGTSSSMGEN